MLKNDSSNHIMVKDCSKFAGRLGKNRFSPQMFVKKQFFLKNAMGLDRLYKFEKFGEAKILNVQILLIVQLAKFL